MDHIVSYRAGGPLAEVVADRSRWVRVWRPQGGAAGFRPGPGTMSAEVGSETGADEKVPVVLPVSSPTAS